MRAALVGLALLASPLVAGAQWARDDNSLAWQRGDAVVWRFSFDKKFGKTFFDPVAVGSGTPFTNFKPADHPWHYGLWFSWKYINHVNYWEEDRNTGQAAGYTRWTTPVIDTRPNGSATIRYDVSYSKPTGEVDMTEHRELAISAPAKDGSYYIDWTMHFTAGKDGAILDRTAMPGEPNGAVNGGYAGLSVRLAPAPMMMTIMTSDGPVTEFARDRARPFAAATAGNFAEGGQDKGGIAILSDAANIADKAPWYIINSATDFRFICAAILAPAIRALPAGGTWDLRYRVALKGTAWTQDALRDELKSWKR
ncbi:MAG: hypothetical protein JWM95_1006 [Gemmatimonadetes bacterium]|nr:hypothetical protein [Gemmatimonadota bacterium]